MIELKNISKTFSDGMAEKEVLKPTSLSLDRGKFIAIVGPSGSGKSTLLTIMGALQRPTKGTLLVNQKDVYAMSENERSALRFNEIGFVLQGSNLVPYLTVKEQFELKIRQSKDKTAKERLIPLLKQLSIDTLQAKYPDEISGGERQRVAIGLALILNPAILLADEPTASLDSEKAFQVVALLQKISKERDTCVVMVTHDQRMSERCDLILEMNDGTLTVKEG